jgi:2-C-methyl-D-erythritol 4-phosphate cytidylyltransferase
MKVTAIIVAAGQGLRMEAAVRKQYMALKGEPILLHTLRAFCSAPAVQEICLVVPEEDMAFCSEYLLPRLSARQRIQLVAGGAERQDSVFNGLQAVSDPDRIILVHDGVRPFISIDLINACIQETMRSGACLAGIPAFDTLKQLTDDHTIEKTLDRQGIWLAQTPQAFTFDILSRAHKKAAAEGYRATDDAMLVERLGKPVKMVHGSRMNIKITTKEDLKLAEALAATEGNPFLSGVK